MIAYKLLRRRNPSNGATTMDENTKRQDVQLAAIIHRAQDLRKRLPLVADYEDDLRQVNALLAGLLEATEE